MRQRALIQLRVYLTIFICFSTFGLVNRLVQFIAPEDANAPWFVMLMLQALTMPLQGLANAIAFGRALRPQAKRQVRALGIDASGAAVIEAEVAQDAAATLGGPVTATAQIFAGSFNVGEANPPPADELRRWLPPSKDVYIIGLQECLDTHKWGAAVADALGGAERWHVTERHMGSGATALGYHGFILLLVLVRADWHASGEWSEVRLGRGGGASVRRGKNLGVKRAENKGAVGAAFRFHATTLAVAACHLAADKKGRSGRQKRVHDLQSVLRDLELEYDDPYGFDVTFYCHHLLLLGDLNFRVNVSADEAIEHIGKRDLAPLLASDELGGAMASGEHLNGFTEHPIAFPPTFRRIVGAALADDERGADGPPIDAERLHALYSTAASDGTARAPSWTDRILRHSLPDLDGQLTCSFYDSCEEITISDHKPVGSHLELHTVHMPAHMPPRPTRQNSFFSRGSRSNDDERSSGSLGVNWRRALRTSLPNPRRTTTRHKPSVRELLLRGRPLKCELSFKPGLRVFVDPSRVVGVDADSLRRSSLTSTIASTSASTAPSADAQRRVDAHPPPEHAAAAAAAATAEQKLKAAAAAAAACREAAARARASRSPVWRAASWRSWWRPRSMSSSWCYRSPQRTRRLRCSACRVSSEARSSRRPPRRGCPLPTPRATASSSPPTSACRRRAPPSTRSSRSPPAAAPAAPMTASSARRRSPCFLRRRRRTSGRPPRAAAPPPSATPSSAASSRRRAASSA